MPKKPAPKPSKKSLTKATPLKGPGSKPAIALGLKDKGEKTSMSRPRKPVEKAENPPAKRTSLSRPRKKSLDSVTF